MKYEIDINLTENSKNFFSFSSSDLIPFDNGNFKDDLKKAKMKIKDGIKLEISDKKKIFAANISYSKIPKNSDLDNLLIYNIEGLDYKLFTQGVHLKFDESSNDKCVYDYSFEDKEKKINNFKGYAEKIVEILDVPFNNLDSDPNPLSIYLNIKKEGKVSKPSEKILEKAVLKIEIKSKSFNLKKYIKPLVDAITSSLHYIKNPKDLCVKIKDRVKNNNLLHYWTEINADMLNKSNYQVFGQHNFISCGTKRLGFNPQDYRIKEVLITVEESNDEQSSFSYSLYNV